MTTFHLPVLKEQLSGLNQLLNIAQRIEQGKCSAADCMHDINTLYDDDAMHLRELHLTIKSMVESANNDRNPDGCHSA